MRQRARRIRSCKGVRVPAEHRSARAGHPSARRQSALPSRPLSSRLVSPPRAALLALMLAAAAVPGPVLAAPIVQAVGDGGTYTNSPSTLSATWIASGQVTQYKYAIGTSPGGTNVKGWTSVGLNTSVTVNNLSLGNGVTYYFAVRAYDVSGAYGSGNSDGIKVDLANPVMNAVIDSGEFTGDATKLSFSFSATDAESGIKEYTYAIGVP